MLAGRKLLLADDSITIQKVVDLTFADEGVTVICFGNGRDAVDKLEEIAPDIVLADVFMPQMSGYEVCEHIKGNEKLKHIPVMLLVGSFEPFDEAEARRVGADDILTKPFQSIRRLIDKVGGLVSKGSSEDAPTADLPKAEEPAAEPETLSTEELEITTADTQRLPTELHSLAAESRVSAAQPDLASEKPADDKKMETSLTGEENASARSVDSADALLDLGDFESVDDAIGEDFVLDLELNESIAPMAMIVTSTSAVPAFAEARMSESRGDWDRTAQPEAGTHADPADQFAPTQDFGPPGFSTTTHDAPLRRITDDPEDMSRGTSRLNESNAPFQRITLDQLAPEVIDAIARRAVEQLSEKVVQEIAWEVVPEFAELMIRRQLEEKKS